MGAVLQDVRFALRMFRRSPGFSALAVLTLAAGIGADTAIFSVADALLLRQMPYRDPARLVLLDAERPAENIHQGPLTWVRFQQVRDRNRSFDGIAAVTSETFNLTGRGEPEQLAAARVSWNFFRILGVTIPLGREFLPEEDRTGSAPTAIISDSLWRRRFGRSRAVLGATLTLDTRDYTIVGVAPPGFEFTVPLGPGIDVFTTHPDELNGVTPQMVQSGVGYLWYVARLKPGVAISAAQAEMNVLAAAWRRDNPKMPDADPALVVHAGNLRDEVVSGMRTAVLVLFGAVSLVLLIACANVASLLLSRAIGRRREIAVRCAIGATRGALIRQLLVESLLAAGLAGVLGAILGAAGTRALAQLAATTLPRASEIATDTGVLTFTAAISLLAGLAFGLIPALQVSRPDLNSVLRSEGRGSTGGKRHHAMRGILVVSQVALSTVLLICSGLLVRNFVRLSTTSPGFDQRHLLTMLVGLPQARYSTPAQMRSFAAELLRETRAVPGVAAAAITTALPVNPVRFTPALPEGQPDVPLAQRPIFNLQQVSDGYGAAMRIPVVRGREFGEHDTADSPRVVMINQTTARRFFPGQNPVGRHVLVGRMPAPSEIVGVLGDVRNQSLTQDVQPELYVPLAQISSLNLNLVVRTATGPHTLAAAVVRRVHAIDKDQPVTHIQTMQELLDAGAAQPHFTTWLLGGLAATALLLALIGIYGVVGYSVAERTQEMGIRIALGADSGDILSLVLRQGLTPAASGIVIGLAASFALTRLIASLLYQVSLLDPLTYLGGPLLFAAVALLAAYLPARRATRVDPMEALRTI
ncbi:MAG: ABC transporter permease [Acidobacteria bacterium]|nr:ABC transporter permease [Acidobacteriota bacterium]